MSQGMYSYIDTWNKRWYAVHIAVVAVVENGCFARDLMSDVDVIFCLHELLLTMEEKLRTELPQRALP